METVYYFVTDSSRSGYRLIDDVGEGMIVESAKSVWGFLSNRPIKQTPKLQIKAVYNSEVCPLELYLLKRKSSNAQEKSNVFYTVVPCGEYVYFEVVKTKVRYVGDILNKDLRLNLLKPKNSCQLEHLCKEKNFFFIGEKTVK